MVEILYQMPLKNIKFIDRKVKITADKTLIIGASGSGKTALVCEFLSRFKTNERLYIDLSDLRVDEILGSLGKFLKSHDEIRAVCVEGVKTQSEIEILKNQVKNEFLIITTQNKTLNFSPFSTIFLGYLDYEEFILFFKKNLDESMLFSHFLAHGVSLKSAFIDASFNAEILQNELKSKLSFLNLSIIKECANFVSLNVSAFEIFKALKQKMKISKNSVYSGFNELCELGYILNVPKFSEHGAKNRLFFANFALKNALSLKKDFTQSFKNAVFCELLKLNSEIFYTKELDFYLPKRGLGVLCLPFLDAKIALLKFQKLHANFKALNITKIQIISVSNADFKAFEGIRCEVVPFYRWALAID
ncbi:ATP-binding protein [Campylobacter gastrosuis]|uniref:ATP-binding protein n=1 Tax=Campylobacter gastrosuis TaxID=2974576 RepID=A0ABT7HT35_9BACT|nr:ATP-binding protein [Campylobacter gastrosuis]MDL0089778.1 ATP-binding protein [Campylobacter gastrosuis]